MPWDSWWEKTLRYPRAIPIPRAWTTHQPVSFTAGWLAVSTWVGKQPRSLLIDVRRLPFHTAVSTVVFNFLPHGLPGYHAALAASLPYGQDVQYWCTRLQEHDAESQQGIRQGFVR